MIYPLNLLPNENEKLTDVDTWLSPSGGPCLASPKSESFALKSSSSRMFDVLKSRNISCTNYEAVQNNMDQHSIE